MLLSSRRKEGDETPISSPDEALALVAEIEDLTALVRRTPGLEEGKVEEIERGIDAILRDYSDMNPRRPGRFLRDLSDVATVIESAHKQGTISDKQRKILELTVKKTRMRDFYAARRLLIKFSRSMEIKKERDGKLDRYRSYHRKLENRSRELRTQIAHMKTVPMPEKALEEVDAIKLAVEEYNEAATGALVDFFAHAPCVEALTLALRASSISDIDFPKPKNRESVNELAHALEEEHVRKAFGGENLSRLVEAANFSEKRLEHFVSDYKWFQRKLQENVEWLSDVTARGSGALRMTWQEHPEALRSKIPTFESFLKALPRSERALQALAKVDKLLGEGHYEAALRSEGVYRIHGDAAAAKFNGTLADRVEALEKEYAEVQGYLARLPAPEKLLVRGTA